MGANPIRKRFGQHFLHDAYVITDIVELIAPQRGEHIIEIGPGRGALTRPLLDAGSRVDCVEIDRDLVQRLQNTLAEYASLTVHLGDALKFDFNRLRAPGSPTRVVGNLPYNISTPLLLRLMNDFPWTKEMVFMLQREVVDRLGATPGNRSYGRLTVVAQSRCHIDGHFEVEPSAFDPPPAVESRLVQLRPRAAQLSSAEFTALERVVACAFGQRRKALRNSLKALMNAGRIESIGIDPALRAEHVKVDEFEKLARAVATELPDP